MHFRILVVVWIVSATCLSGQGIGIGTTNVAPSALLELESSTKGVLLTRMSTVQRKAVANPAPGLMVYDTDKHTIYLFDGIEWNPMMFVTNESLLPPLGVRASDGMVGDQFGWSVDIHGPFAVIGAPDDQVGNNLVQGSAYVFENVNGLWTEKAKLVASDGASEDFFGRAVAIDGDYIVIGAPYKTIGGQESAGKAYVFKRNGATWTEQAILQASNFAQGDFFGASVSISGDRIAIGAPHKTIGGQSARGCAYIFTRNGAIWTQQAMLNPPLGQAGDEIGSVVRIKNNKVAISAPYDDYNSIPNAGSVYMYVFNGTLWIMEGHLTSSYAHNHSLFGTSVDLSDSLLVVGMPQFQFNSIINMGLVLVYTFSGGSWSLAIDILPPDMQQGMLFGYCVAIDQNRIIASAPNMQVEGHAQQGKAWVFRREGSDVVLERSMMDGDGKAFDYFGRQVALSGDDVIIGVYKKDQNRGKVFFTNLE